MGKISRRNFINGTLVAAGSSLLPLILKGQDAMASMVPSYYPPALTGLRGSHPGSNDHAHARAWNQKSDWGVTTELSEHYDLVVVGGGLSGLSAAFFYQQKHGRNKKVLILDNHDDFGGHAKRNEHTVDGNTLIGYGGSQTLMPEYADDIVLKLLKDIGVDLDRFKTTYDRGFYKRHDLESATYFNKAVFGEDKVVRHPYCNFPNFVEGLKGPALSNEEAAKSAPLSNRGKEQLLRVLNGGLHAIDIPSNKLGEYTRKTSYFDYLKDTLGVDDPAIFRMARSSGLDWADTGADLMNIRQAKNYGAMGFAPVTTYDKDHPYIHHFPDGNAGVARSLVKKLIPQVAPGNNAEELVLAKFNYTALDKPENSARIRLNSTVVDVKHNGNLEDTDEVLINYIQENRSYQVKAKSVVMACYNMMIPHIVSGLPNEQAEALRLQQKCPLQYTSVGLKNWRAMKELGIGFAMCPGNIHQGIQMDFPVSMGGYEFTKSPDDPCVIQMFSCPYGETMGAPRSEQYKEARYRMLAMQFKDYEDEIREHLTGMLPDDLFDFDRDVESITLNRWAHGYTIAGPGDSVQIGRQPFGRITIANTDSAPGSLAHDAIAMAHRAVKELE